VTVDEEKYKIMEKAYEAMLGECFGKEGFGIVTDNTERPIFEELDKESKDAGQVPNQVSKEIVSIRRVIFHGDDELAARIAIEPYFVEQKNRTPRNVNPLMEMHNGINGSKAFIDAFNAFKNKYKAEFHQEWAIRNA